MSDLVLPLATALARPSSDLFKEPGSISFYTKASFCGEKAVLDRMLEAGEDTDDAPATGKADAKTVGKVFHAILEYYHPQGFDNVVFEYSDNALQPSVDEAYRLFRAYRQKVPAWVFGQTVGAELALPRTLEEKAAIESIVGVAPFKLVIDLVSVLGQREVDWWFDNCKLELPGPGLYLTDHKSMGRRKSHMNYRFTRSLQFQTYMHVWKGLYPQGYPRWSDAEVKDMFGPDATSGVAPLRGMIANCVIANKEPAHEPYFADVDHMMPLEVVRQSMRRAREWADTRYKNPFNCVSDMYVCPYALDGTCNMTNHGGQ